MTIQEVKKEIESENDNYFLYIPDQISGKIEKIFSDGTVKFYYYNENSMKRYITVPCEEIEVI